MRYEDRAVNKTKSLFSWMLTLNKCILFDGDKFMKKNKEGNGWGLLPGIGCYLGCSLEVLLGWRPEVSEGLNHVIKGAGDGVNRRREWSESAGELFKH